LPHDVDEDNGLSFKLLMIDCRLGDGAQGEYTPEFFCYVKIKMR
jgi:hypothetical protein